MTPHLRAVAHRAVACWLLIAGAVSIAPKFSWQTVGNMTFFHACNESGLWSEEALDVIQKFQIVTVEKGQGFTDRSGNGTQAETHIIAQLAAIKARDPTIQTVFYMNSVLNWFFYEMAAEYEAMPANWMYDSKTRQPVRATGDKTFQPQPKDGMLVFNHALPAVRAFWKGVCENAVASGFVDGCFSDSSQPDSNGTGKHLNETDHAAFEAGKVRTMSELTARFGGQAGQPYPSDASGVLIGKKPDQEGINAFQIEMFRADESQIEVLQQGVAQGYLVQAHIAVGEASGKCGCACIESDLAAFLIGAGNFSYFGFGPWISPGLADVQGRWCPDLFDRPLGEPLSNGTRDDNGVWTRAFASGTRVTFFGKNGTGIIEWSGPATPTPPPATRHLPTHAA